MKRCLIFAVALILLGSTAVYAQGNLDYGAAMTGAKIHYKGSRWEKAANLFRSAIGMKPNAAEAHFWLGLTLAQIGRESLLSAAAEFDTAFAQDTAYPARVVTDQENEYLVTRALSASAEALMTQSQFHDAIRYVRWALAINPSNPNYYMTLGNAFVGLDEPDSIRLVAADLEKKEKESGQASFFMGIYYAKKDSSEPAMTNFATAGFRYEAAMARQRDKLDTLLQLKSVEKTEQIAGRLLALRNFQAALKSYIEDTLKSPHLLQQLAEISNNLFIDRFQTGLSFYRAGMASIQLGHAATDTLVAARYFWKADTLYRHAAAADAENYDALWYVGYADYRLGRDTATIEAFRKAILVSEARKDMVAEKDAELWMYLGTSEARQKMYDSAIVHLRRALKADPTRTDAYTNLAFSYKDKAGSSESGPLIDTAAEILGERDNKFWHISIWSASDAEQLGTAKAGDDKRFVSVEFTLFNKTDQADSAYPARLTLSCDDKKDYAFDEAVTGSDVFDGRGFKAIAPVDMNGKLDGAVAFVVPKGVKPVALVYKPKSGSEVREPIR